MKTNFKLLAMAAVAMLAMNSCEKENEMSTGEQKGTPVEFEMGINSITKTTTADNSYETTFAEGDEVGIFVYNGETLVTANAHYKLTDGKWVAQGEGIYAEEGVSYSYYAYYPYSADATDATSVSLSVATDQTAGYTGSDALMAKNESVAAGTTTVDLTYSHAFALVQVTLKGDQVSKGSTVTLQNIYPTAKLNLKGSSIGAAEGAQGTVAMKDCSAADATTYSYRAIVPAQTISAGYAILTISSGDKNYKFTYSKDVPYESGTVRQYDVTLGEQTGTSITIGNQPIDNWQEGTAVEGGEGTIDEIITPVDAISVPITADIQPVVGGKYNSSALLNMEEEGWFSRYAEDYGATLKFAESAVTIQMPDTTDLGKVLTTGWNQCSFGYHANGPVSGNYKFSCTISSVGNIKTSGGFMLRTSDDKMAFTTAYNEGFRTTHTFTKAAGDQTEETTQNISFTVNFDQKSTEAKSSVIPNEKIEPTTTEDLTDIYIYIYNNSFNTTFSISNIKLERITE